VSPLRGEKPQNRPLSKLNTGSFALRAMLPVTKIFINIPKHLLTKMHNINFNYTNETMNCLNCAV